MRTYLYAAILAIFYVILSIYVVLGRRRFKVALWDGQEKRLLRRIRVHGNFSEYTPFFLILLFFVESEGLSHSFIHTLGIAFLIGRVSHLYSVLVDEPALEGTPVKYYLYRAIGMSITFTCLLVMALFLLLH